MNSLLRGLMASDGNTNRPLPSLILLGIVDFVCILMAAESFRDRQLAAGAMWLAAGIASSLIGYYWPQIKVRLGIRPGTKADLPEHRPRVFPVDYAKAEKRDCYGLYVRNPGYDALDVELPDVPVGKSMYVLEFPQRLAQLSERAGNGFLEAWLKHETLPGLDGGQLHEVMRKADVESIEFVIVYKDTDFRTFTTDCFIRRTNRSRSGLEVGATGQKMLPDATQKGTLPS